MIYIIYLLLSSLRDGRCIPLDTHLGEASHRFVASEEILNLNSSCKRLGDSTTAPKMLSTPFFLFFSCCCRRGNIFCKHAPSFSLVLLGKINFWWREGREHNNFVSPAIFCFSSIPNLQSFYPFHPQTDVFSCPAREIKGASFSAKLPNFTTFRFVHIYQTKLFFLVLFVFLLPSLVVIQHLLPSSSHLQQLYCCNSYVPFQDKQKPSEVVSTKLLGLIKLTAEGFTYGATQPKVEPKASATSVGSTVFAPSL